MSSLAAKAALGALRLIARLPVPLIRTLSTPVSWLVYALAPARRHVTMTNLGRCFPHWTQARRREVARGHFYAFVVTFFERFVFWFAPADKLTTLCTVEGAEHFDSGNGEPTILLAPHFVGMDAGGVRFSIETQMASMYARQKSRTLTEVMTQGRSRFGGHLLLRTDGLRGAVRMIRDGIPFYFLPDMDLGPRDAVFVPFFGVPAATVTSVARMSRITRARIVPCVSTLTRTGYQLRFYPAWKDFPGEDDAAATARMNRFIEERVLEAPEQYLWSHKRFKTRPEGESGLY